MPLPQLFDKLIVTLAWKPLKIILLRFHLRPLKKGKVWHRQEPTLLLQVWRAKESVKVHPQSLSCINRIQTVAVSKSYTRYLQILVPEENKSIPLLLPCSNATLKLKVGKWVPQRWSWSTDSFFLATLPQKIEI